MQSRKRKLSEVNPLRGNPKKGEYERDGLTIAKSQLPGAGWGAYAWREYKKNEQLGEYLGRELTPEEAEVSKSHYLMDTPDGEHVIDAKDAWRNGFSLIAYVNDLTRDNKKAGFSYNSEFREGKNNDIWLDAIKPIHKGDEIFASYGKKYWSDMRRFEPSTELEWEDEDLEPVAIMQTTHVFTGTGLIWF